MKNKLLGLTSTFILGAVLAAPAGATVIDFTGGTVTTSGNATYVTNGTSLYEAKQYEESGFRLTMDGTGTTVGVYYNNDDVLHAHPSTGAIGTLSIIRGAKSDGSAFQLDQLTVTSDTANGGGAASGTEQAWLHASIDGVTSSFSLLLPPESWGFPGTDVILGKEFDNIKAFWITFANDVDCIGLDNIMFSQAVLENDVPEPGSVALLGFGIAGLLISRRKR